MYKISLSLALFLFATTSQAQNINSSHSLLVNYKKNICYTEVKKIRVVNTKIKKAELTIKAEKLIDADSPVFLHEKIGTTPQDDINAIYKNSIGSIDLNHWLPIRNKIIELQSQNQQSIYFVAYNFDLPIDSNESDKEKVTFRLYEVSCSEPIEHCRLKKWKYFHGFKMHGKLVINLNAVFSFAHIHA